VFGSKCTVPVLGWAIAVGSIRFSRALTAGICIGFASGPFRDRKPSAKLCSAGLFFGDSPVGVGRRFGLMTDVL
jgi:hypothetical protein